MAWPSPFWIGRLDKNPALHEDSGVYSDLQAGEWGDGDAAGNGRGC